MKIALILSIFILAFCATGCLRASSAPNEKQQTVDRKAENKKPEKISHKNPTFDAENIEPPKTENTAAKSGVKTESTDNFVCPDPKLPCSHSQKQFADWELSFRLPERLLPYSTYQSAPFYAVILKTFPAGCAETDADPEAENERLKIQRKFPSRKVFAENSCPHTDAISYAFEGKRDKSGDLILMSDYIAVYAGITEDEAREVFESVKTNYPEADLKKMIATYELFYQ